jgi:hypothetical protein
MPLKLSTAQLIKIFAGELLKLSKHPTYRKKIQDKERKEHNERVIKHMNEQKNKNTSLINDDVDMGDGWIERNWEIKKKSFENLVDLGRCDFSFDKDVSDELLEIELEFTDKAIDKNISRNEAEKLATQLEQENPKYHLKKHLMDIYDAGGPSMTENITVQFYHLPLDQFGKAKVGPSKNLKQPTLREIQNALNQIDLPYNVIVIYSDDADKYKNQLQNIFKESDSGKYTA